MNQGIFFSNMKQFVKIKIYTKNITNIEYQISNMDTGVKII